MREAGFANVKVTNLSGGIAALHTGWRLMSRQIAAAQLRATRQLKLSAPKPPRLMFGSIATFLRLMRAAWTLARTTTPCFRLEYQANGFLRPHGWQARGAPSRHPGPGSQSRASGSARALEELGPSYVKLGQVLATRADVVGMEFARGLSRLQEPHGPLPRSRGRKVVEAELGETPPIDALFADFGPPAGCRPPSRRCTRPSPAPARARWR